MNDIENFLNTSNNDFFNTNNDFLGFESIYDRKNDNTLKFINEELNTSRLDVPSINIVNDNQFILENQNYSTKSSDISKIYNKNITENESKEIISNLKNELKKALITVKASNINISSSSPKIEETLSSKDNIINLLINNGNYNNYVHHYLYDNTGNNTKEEQKMIKGHWRPYEDKILADWIKINGSSNWKGVASLLPGRTSKQCRDRWSNVVNPNLKKSCWEVEEDYIIFKLFKIIGSKWAKISDFLEGRTENSIKNRFYTSLRRMASEKLGKTVKVEKLSFQELMIYYDEIYEMKTSYIDQILLDLGFPENEFFNFKNLKNISNLSDDQKYEVRLLNLKKYQCHSTTELAEDDHEIKKIKELINNKPNFSSLASTFSNDSQVHSNEIYKVDKSSLLNKKRCKNINDNNHMDKIICNNSLMTEMKNIYDLSKENLINLKNNLTPSGLSSDSKGKSTKNSDNNADKSYNNKVTKILDKNIEILDNIPLIPTQKLDEKENLINDEISMNISNENGSTSMANCLNELNEKIENFINLSNKITSSFNENNKEDDKAQSLCNSNISTTESKKNQFKTIFSQLNELENLLKTTKDEIRGFNKKV